MTKVSTFRNIEDFAKSGLGVGLAKEFANEPVERVAPPTLAAAMVASAKAGNGARPAQGAAPSRLPRRSR